MLILQGITYTHPNRDLLFDELDLAINNHDKAALVGNNGAGKSTLLKILAGELRPAAGLVKAEPHPYYVPQLFGQFNNQTVAEALQVHDKLRALKAILAGEVTAENMTQLNDDWVIGDRCGDALAKWQLGHLDPEQPMRSLSGGEKTRVFLAGITIHRPETVLLDEPSNHLDAGGRELLYNYITRTQDTLIVVSHDRTLLNLLDVVYELGNRGITRYGGNYDFYAAQKTIEQQALEHNLKNKEKALRKAKETAREAIERQQKLDARGRKKQDKAGVPTIMLNTLRNNAEKSTSRVQEIHAEKIGAIAKELNLLREVLPGADKMQMDFDNVTLHKGKALVTATGINYHYGGQPLWRQPLSFQLTSGERVAIKGANGSGKTTLIRMILGDMAPTLGTLSRAAVSSVYIDQEYSLIDDRLTVYEQAGRYNPGDLQEHDIKIRLDRFLFGKNDWGKSCRTLSGGEKMRLMLCALMISAQAPDLIVLDEPTNNLDLRNIEILAGAIKEYRGTLIVISHDRWFLEQAMVEKEIVL
ncbi:ABC-F family ATP-binding cassette domain-containing protein [Hufsiella ginkgonis]|uniref:ATP-binding cassette domain-containing protein n=1 Tax=Hufsiella ginkgonis TaxID=2695274 RepID=A0A7K1XXS2_9SPHI|nr:ABC-F family ATP-binding cassette domain-containing protein [Hufsiella ginkgonis]MXV15637.1 ATP-binding cassette domain-containing protein [Hufsiella ginkgonis]